MKYKNSIIWGLLSIFDIWLFLDLIPVEMALESTVFFALIAAIISGFLFSAFVISLFKNGEEDKPESKVGYYIFGAIILGVFCLPIYFIYNQSNKESKLLNKEPVFTFARIVDGKIGSGRKNNSYIKVNFSTIDGQFITEEYSV